MLKRWLFGSPPADAGTSANLANEPRSSADYDRRDNGRGTPNGSAPDRSSGPSLTLTKSLGRRWGDQPLDRSDGPLRILTLGSCRVHNPIRDAAALAEAPVEAVYDELGLPYSYYFHTVRANLQFLSILTRDRTVQPAAWPWLFFEGRFAVPQIARSGGVRALIDSADAILVEVCAEEEIVSGDIALHGQEILRSFVAQGSTATQAWWAALSRGDDARPFFDAAAAEVRDQAPWATPASLAILADAQSYKPSESEIAEGLRELVAVAGKPVFVVTHADAMTTSGQPIARRRAFIETVVSACARAGVPVFQPGTLVEEFGQATVFEKDGADTAHYNAAFQVTVGRRMAAFVSQHLDLTHRRGVCDAGISTSNLMQPTTADVSRKPSNIASAVAHALAFVDLKALESDMVAILKNRIAELGPEGSGLGSYYANRIDIGQAFSASDRQLLHALASGFHDYSEIVEAGAGYGQLGLALAAGGRRVVCIEISTARFDCMVALKAGLQAKYPPIARNALLVRGSWPQILSNHDPSQSLLVAADFVFTAPPETETLAIKALKRHKGAIIDGVHFVHTRLQRADREAFYNTVQDAGLSRPVPINHTDTGGNTEFVFIRDL